MVAVLIATLTSSAILLVTYFIKFQSVAFYRVILNHNLDIPPRENIVFIILPSLIASVLVNLLVALCIGFYASRKYAVPVYKLEQWADLLKKGYIAAKLRFREKDEFKELSTNCNALATSLQVRFLAIQTECALLRAQHPDSESVKKIEAQLAELKLDDESVEVHTGFYKIGGQTNKHVQ